KENLIVVGGTSINKITTLLNNRLRIQYVKMKNYKGNHNNDYLIDRSRKRIERSPHPYRSSSGKKPIVCSVQVIRNPYNEDVTNPSYIIVLFGLDRRGTYEAGKKFIELWKNEFQELMGGEKQGQR